uniref:Acylaminoacyl-peptide hydrolase n=1 Tax=Equus asinus asinus TaxID=83772 RepID=A0A8C4LW81_EQUAS
VERNGNVLLSEPEEAAALYRGLSRQPALSAACLGPEVTTQYGGRYRTVHTDCFGCLSWSHSETHLLYVAEKKRPKAESFFQTKALDIGGSDDEMARLKKPDQAIKVLMAVAS